MLIRLSILALVLSATVLSASSASACDPIAPAPGTTPPVVTQDDSDFHWGIAFTVGGVANATLIGLQLGSIGDMFPVWLAAIELAVGIGETIFGSLMVAASSFGASSCGGNSWGDEALISSGFLIGVGGWLIAHAVWSFVDGAEDPLDDVNLQPTLSASPQGVLVGAIGTF